MKIDVYANDFFVKYNTAPMQREALSQLNLGILEGIYNREDTFILRGEPCYQSEEGFQRLLGVFKAKNYILTTHGYQAEKIIACGETIPYVSFHWDGVSNDLIRRSPGLTYNVMRCLETLRHKKTTVRIAYTISPYNSQWLDADIEALRRLVADNPNMKLPYFILYQRGEYFSNEKFTWPSVYADSVAKLNKSGLLTPATLQFLLAWLARPNYKCTSPMKETVLMPDATVRMCNSHRIGDVIGNLYEKNLQAILAESQPLREAAADCSLKGECWLAYHFKDSVCDAAAQ